MIPVILSGGNGSRLWPLSRASHPKQFLPLTGQRTMLQMTAERVGGLPGIEPPLVVCNQDHRFLVAEQLRELGVDPSDIILEPCGRNTAPAIASAALAKDPDALLLVLPADHLIPDNAAFHAAVEHARPVALDGALVTFGIVPTHPETGYGYIRATQPGGPSPVAEFVEKPDTATAESYLADGRYYWNSGIFLFKASRILEELERHRPGLVDRCRRAFESARRDLDFVRLDAENFAACEGISIDYAVMERTDAAHVVPLNAGWSDLGSWAALQTAAQPDSDGNVLLGDVLAEATSGCYVRSEGRLVATVGIEDCIVVETPDAVLVANRNRSQDVKRIVERLKHSERPECDFHRRVSRPWGWFEGIARADRFQVKHIVVKPGAALSLQMHHHRAEHWVVVRGTARVTCGSETKLVSEDESTYIRIGQTHRLENPGVIPLELIEVQTGSYLGEDDIVRLDDPYQRD